MLWDSVCGGLIFFLPSYTLSLWRKLTQATDFFNKCPLLTSLWLYWLLELFRAVTDWWAIPTTHKKKTSCSCSLFGVRKATEEAHLHRSFTSCLFAFQGEFSFDRSTVFLTSPLNLLQTLCDHWQCSRGPGFLSLSNLYGCDLEPALS